MRPVNAPDDRDRGGRLKTHPILRISRYSAIGNANLGFDGL